MRQTTSLSFALLLASGLFSAGGIAAPHGSSNDLVQRDPNIINERLADIGRQRRNPETDENNTSNGPVPDENTTDQNTTGTALLKTLKRLANTILGRAVSEEEEQAAHDIAQENKVSGNVARDVPAGASHARAVRKAMIMERQFLNETTPTNESVTDPDVVLSRRSPAARTTVLFPRQFINGTTPTNRTVTEPAVVLSRDGTSASARGGRGLVVRTAVLLPRQFTNGTGNGTEFAS